MRSVAIACLLCVVVGCGRISKKGDGTTDNPVEKNRQAIASALRALLERADKSDAYIIFTEPRSERFVQFAIASDGGLLFDLPAQTLHGTEMERAADYFREVGEEIQEYDVFDREGKPAGKMRSFQVKLGMDVDRATDIVLTVLQRVYGFPPDCELAIDQN